MRAVLFVFCFSIFLNFCYCNDAVEDFYYIEENTMLTLDVLANDVYVAPPYAAANMADFSVTIADDATNGSTMVDASFAIIYTPNTSYLGPDTFSYILQSPQSDTAGAPIETDTAVVDLIVISSSTLPQAIVDMIATAQNISVNINVLSNDQNIASYPSGVVSIASTPSNGVATVNPDGTIFYNPDDSFVGSDSFDYTFSDRNLATTGTVFVTVESINGLTAITDFVALDEDSTIDIDVLNNDINPNGDVLTLTITVEPTSGSAFIDYNTNLISYIPIPNFNGADSFEYQIANFNSSDTANVMITVSSVVDPPIAVDDFAATGSDINVSINVLSNDINVDGNPLIVQIQTNPSNGTITLEIDDSITYDPEPNFFGTVSFIYSITDNQGNSDNATVTVTIEELVGLTAIDDFTNTLEDIPIDIPVVLNDVNPEGTPLTLSVTTLPTFGSAVPNAGLITYTPIGNFFGTDTFEYQISNSTGAFDRAIVTVTVTSVSDAPEAVDDEISTAADSPVDIFVLLNDVNVDGSNLIVSIDNFPSNGAVTVNDATGGINYTPDFLFTGTDTFVYRITSPNAQSSTAVVTVTVVPVAGGITAIDDYFYGVEDSPVVINVVANDVFTLNGGETLTVIVPAAHGNTTVSATLGSITYTPDPNYYGTDTFVYRFSSGSQSSTAVVTMTIQGQPDPVFGVADFATTAQGNSITIDVLANDINVDDDMLQVTIFSSPASGSLTVQANGNIVYSPNTGFSGTDTFIYRIEDEQANRSTALVTVTVVPVSGAIVAIPDFAETNEDTPVVIPVLSNDANPNGDSLILSVLTSPQNGIAVATTVINYTPSANYFGTDTFVYQISGSSGQTASALVTVTVLPVNNDPVAAVDDTASTFSNTTVTINVLANDINPDNDPLALLIVTQPSNGTATLDPSGTAIIYTPEITFSGIASFTYSITDPQGNTATATVSVTVIIVSPTPTVTPTSSPSNSTTPTPSITPSILQSASGTISETASSSPSRSFSATPSQSRIMQTDAATPSNSGTPTISRFSSPSPSQTIPFPYYLPDFLQPAGVQTGEVIIQLRTVEYSFGVGISRQLQETIAIMMDIPLEAVIVIRITAYQQATVIICGGDIDGFFNSLNNREAVFDDTMLDNAYSEFIFWGVPCRNPLDDLPIYDNPPSPDDTTYDVGFDFSTFRFPEDYLNSPESPSSDSSSSGIASSRYLSNGNIVIPIDDDDYFIIENDAALLNPLLLISIIAILFTLLF